MAVSVAHQRPAENRAVSLPANALRRAATAVVALVFVAGLDQKNGFEFTARVGPIPFLEKVRWDFAIGLPATELRLRL